MTRVTISKFGGFPLGALQVFAPIRMGNVPDCSKSHDSLGCSPSASPSEEGSSRIRGTVRPEAGQHLDIRLCLAVPPEMLVSGGSLSSAPVGMGMSRQGPVREVGE